MQVIVPHKAHSSGTIISLGANEIIMTKQATLGPDRFEFLHTPLNPRLQDGGIYPVSVEAVKGYLEFAKNEMQIDDTASLASIFEKLTDFVHPLVLGEVLPFQGSDSNDGREITSNIGLRIRRRLRRS